MDVASEHGRRTEPFESGVSWRTGGLAGFVATVVMGLVIGVMDLATLRVAIAGLYGFEGSLVAGWVAHLAHGTLFGVVFAGVLADPGLYRVSEWLWKTVVAGVVFGLVLAVAGAGIVLPIWLGAVGVDVGASIPFVTVPSLLWHTLYGVVLGVGFHVGDGG
ncbi:histidine kinase [Salinigranum salinum]|uniref:histidine kinase n=1 Tax=Salinigranum salinum TaxID=1364937 RepID=UPI0012609E6C|nr:histidine kinase [Salinigranum salinum]